MANSKDNLIPFNSETARDAANKRWALHREANINAIVQKARDKGYDVDNIYDAVAIANAIQYEKAIEEGNPASLRLVNQAVDDLPRADQSRTTINDNRTLIVNRTYVGLPENIRELAETKSPETAAYILAQLDPDKNEPQEITYRDEIRDWSNE